MSLALGRGFCTQMIEEKGKEMGRRCLITPFCNSPPHLYLWQALWFHSVASLGLICKLEKNYFWSSGEKIQCRNWEMSSCLRKKMEEILIANRIFNRITIQYTYIPISFSGKSWLKFFFTVAYCQELTKK